MPRPYRCLALAVLALAACTDGSLDVDLFAESAAPDVDSVFVTVESIALERDGGTDVIELDQPLQIDLMSLEGDRSVRLLDGESLEIGRYTGIRLVLEDDPNDEQDNYVVRDDGSQYPVRVAEGENAGLRFSVEEEDGDRYGALLSVNLLFSLRFDENDDEYELTPVLRAVLDEDEAAVSGRVDSDIVEAASCRDGRATGAGVAVYAFAGHDVTPDDYDNANAEPLASAFVTAASDGWRYRLHVLEAGDYTLALTCFADEEDPGADDSEDLEFRDNAIEVELDDGQEEDADFD